MNRLLFGTTLALTASVACGGDDGGISNPTGDSGGGGDTSMTGDGAPGTDSAGMDSSGNPDSSGDAATFNVGMVPGLALWLNAAKDVTVVSGKVTLWHDQSGNNNDASQKNVNYEPAPVTSSINGNPGVHFNATAGGSSGNYGNMMVISDSATLDWSTGDYLIEAVVSYDNATKTGLLQNDTGVATFYSKQQYSPGGAGYPLGTGAALYGNAYGNPSSSTSYSGYADTSNMLISAATGYNDGKGHIFAVQRVGTTLSLRLNGAQTDTKSIASVNVDLGNAKPLARIGASGDANFFRLNGDIDEVIAVKGTIASSDQAGIEGYLKTKYGL